MDLGKNLAARRKSLKMTQEELAEKLDVTFQAVSSWERGECSPDIERLPVIAAVLKTDVSTLLGEKKDYGFTLKNRIFSEERGYTYLKSAYRARKMNAAEKALQLAKEKHDGQFRKSVDGEEALPYIVHPITMACHAMAMGLMDEDLAVALLLHDVCEDCGVRPEDLQITETAEKAVRLVTFSSGMSKDDYYKRISQNALASMVKCIDRCSNVSVMPSGFNSDKIADYIKETEKYYPELLDTVRHSGIEGWNNAAWLLRYQIFSSLETCKRLI